MILHFWCFIKTFHNSWHFRYTSFSLDRVSLDHFLLCSDWITLQSPVDHFITDSSFTHQYILITTSLLCFYLLMWFGYIHVKLCLKMLHMNNSYNKLLTGLNVQSGSSSKDHLISSIHTTWSTMTQTQSDKLNQTSFKKTRLLLLLRILSS